MQWVESQMYPCICRAGPSSIYITLRLFLLLPCSVSLRDSPPALPLHSPKSRTMAQQQQIRYGPVHHVRWDNRNEACSSCFFVNPIVLYNKHRIFHLFFALVPMWSTLSPLYVSCLLYSVNKLFSIASTERYTSMGHTPRSIMSCFHITSA